MMIENNKGIIEGEVQEKGYAVEKHRNKRCIIYQCRHPCPSHSAGILGGRWQVSKADDKSLSIGCS
jgi:hypothetical protein